MAISVFDMFKIGIGPSSSHTVGPMRAANRFLMGLEEKGLLESTAAVVVELYGSLALTGIGHGTDKAVMLGLEGEEPDKIDPDTIDARLEGIRTQKKIKLKGRLEIGFDEQENIVFLRRKILPLHPNGMRFMAMNSQGEVIHERTYYSIGGGFVVNQETAEQDRLKMDTTPIPYPFKTADELHALTEQYGLTIPQLMLENEKKWRTEAEIVSGLQKIWGVMDQCIDRGCRREGVLPGKLKVRRRAPQLLASLTREAESALKDPLTILDWVNLYALAVNEENASGSRVVTAPTNGAAGIIPAVIRYYLRFCPDASTDGVNSFLLTAGAIGILYMENASISGAEVGCQGEVGVACSMAAGGLVAALGGTFKKIEQAAEIGMEHNLGLTCDPIGGLVQIPCIERNAMGAVKAINAARIAMRGDGNFHVSLDSVIKTMRQTGADMKTKYKETSRGGLAVNVTEC